VIDFDRCVFIADKTKDIKVSITQQISYFQSLIAAKNVLVDYYVWSCCNYIHVYEFTHTHTQNVNHTKQGKYLPFI